MDAKPSSQLTSGSRLAGPPADDGADILLANAAGVSQVLPCHTSFCKNDLNFDNVDIHN